MSLGDLTEHTFGAAGEELGSTGVATVAIGRPLSSRDGSLKDTADYTKQNSKYMLWSVVVLAIASVTQVLVTYLKP